MNAVESSETGRIRNELLDRARAAKDKLGPNWRAKVIKYDPFFDTMKGTRYLDAFSSAIGPKGKNVRIGLDRMIPITKAIEKAAGIEYEPITI